MNNKKLTAVFFCMAVILILSLYTAGCADDPSSLGLNFIPPGETTGVRIFDSYIDTMEITSSNHRYYVNTSSSTNLMVGKYGDYETKALMHFSGLSGDYDSATVNSALIKLNYMNYYFPSSSADSLGQISFDVFKIEQKLNFSQITLDSVNSSTFGIISQGSFIGSPTTDSQEVFVTLNTSMVKDWLEYAADTNYANKNYGIVLSPGNASSVIKGFYSGLTSLQDLRPSIQIIVTKNGDTDTLNYFVSSTISLSNTNFAASTETFNLQAGVSYVQLMHFDLSHIPPNSTINDVQLFLTLDQPNSVVSSQASYSIFSQFVTDTAGLKTDIVAFKGSPDGSGQYVTRLVSRDYASPFQRWLLGETNYGIMIFAGNQTKNLDRYTFYKETASDPNKRPRVIIKYTPRARP
jgi:hypothetical protein